MQQVVSQPPAQVQTDCCGNPTGDVTQNKTLMRGLAIAEIVFGVLILIDGAILSMIASSGGRIRYQGYYNSYRDEYYYYYRYPFTTGEGIWCGLFIITAGSTGISAAKPDSTLTTINAHMGLSIVAAVMCGPLFSLAVLSPLIFPTLGFVVVNSFNAIFALACLGMHIRSAHLCCLCKPGGCCCGQTPQATTQIVYATQQPGIAQVGGPGYGTQGYPLQVQGQVALTTQQPVGAYQPGQINPGYFQQAIPAGQTYTVTQGPGQVITSAPTSPTNQGYVVQGQATRQQDFGSPAHAVPPAYYNK